jgi:hypothetical protein
MLDDNMSLKKGAETLLASSRFSIISFFPIHSSSDIPTFAFLSFPHGL